MKNVKVIGGAITKFGKHMDRNIKSLAAEAVNSALEDAGIIFPMLDDLGIQLDVVKSHVSVGVENEIIHIENLDSLTEYKNLLIKIYPESKAHNT